MKGSLATTLLVFLAILGVCLMRYAPPAVRGLDAPPSAFSGARAREIQRAISEDGLPRAIGTDSNARARAFLEAELTKTGWKTEIQSATACTQHGACGRVKNIVATRAGSDAAASAVLLMAHYDSVACSPGATDDGFGTAAVVESARAIGASPPLRRTVIVVLTDGEEPGLLGAEAFAHQHPLARTVRGVVNVESRGSGGPSAMFETSAGNGWVVGLLARNLDRPVTSSIFYEIYRRMPNDTDFTAIKEQAQGVNFSNIAGVERYHTSRDSYENADPRTLQHHGDQALAMIRALADSGPELDAPHPVTNDAVWFDVLATFIVRWPGAASLGLALTALGLVLGWAIRMRAWRSGLRGLAAPLAALVSAALAAFAVGAGLQALGALPVPWPAHPLPVLITMHGACIMVGTGAARLVAGRSSAQALWAGTWLTWAVLGVVAATVAPGASFLFVVPTLAAGLFAWLRVDVAAAAPALVAAILWMPIALLGYDALGVIVPALTCISPVVLVSTLPALAIGDARVAPGSGEMRARRRVAFGAGAVVAAAALVTLIAPRFSVAIPQRVNVVFRQDEVAGAAAPARVYVEAAWAYRPWGKAPEGMVRALGDPRDIRVEAPWAWSSPVPMVEVPRVALPAPTAVSAPEDAASLTQHLRITSPRGAGTIVILLPAGEPLTIDVDGVHAYPRRNSLIVRAVPAEGVEVLLRRQRRGPLQLTIFDITRGLPPRSDAPIAQAVLEARPPEAVPTQEGDITLVGARFEF